MPEVKMQEPNYPHLWFGKCIRADDALNLCQRLELTMIYQDPTVASYRAPSGNRFMFLRTSGGIEMWALGA